MFFENTIKKITTKHLIWVNLYFFEQFSRSQKCYIHNIFTILLQQILNGKLLMIIV